MFFHLEEFTERMTTFMAFTFVSSLNINEPSLFRGGFVLFLIHSWPIHGNSCFLKTDLCRFSEKCVFLQAEIIERRKDYGKTDRSNTSVGRLRCSLFLCWNGKERESIEGGRNARESRCQLFSSHVSLWFDATAMTTKVCPKPRRLHPKRGVQALQRRGNQVALVRLFSTRMSMNDSRISRNEFLKIRGKLVVIRVLIKKQK